MAGRGVHFALAPEDVARIRGVPEPERFTFVIRDIETEWFDGNRHWLAESDKAWDAIHRALADGFLHWMGGAYPLNHVVLGGEFLCDADHGVLLLKSPDHVRDASAALAVLSDEEFARRYWAIPSDDYEFGTDEDDLEYVQHWFAVVKGLYARAAAAGRSVLFTVDL